MVDVFVDLICRSYLKILFDDLICRSYLKILFDDLIYTRLSTKLLDLDNRTNASSSAEARKWAFGKLTFDELFAGVESCQFNKLTVNHS